MPVIKSAKKKMKQALKHEKHNREIKNAVKQKIKATKKAIGTDPKELAEKLSQAFSEIDRAAKRNVIHKNVASRKKSRLSRLVSKGKEAVAIKKKKTTTQPPKKTAVKKKTLKK